MTDERYGHFHPLDDVIEHTFDDNGQCRCKPQMAGEYWMHNALDGRDERDEPLTIAIEVVE